MQLEISSGELRALTQLVDSRLEELHPEIRRCRNYRYRLDLKEEFDHLQRLLERMQSQLAEAPDTARPV
jgi:hypothetical protein